MTDVVKGVLRVDADYDFAMVSGDGVISGHTLYARNRDWQPYVTEVTTGTGMERQTQTHTETAGENYRMMNA